MTDTPDSEDGPLTSSSRRHAIRDGIDTVRTQASEVAHKTVEQAKDGLGHARDTASDAYALARTKVSDAGKRAADSVDTNPIAVLAGGLVIGALIGALLPRTEREAKALGSVGEKINDLAREAMGAAKGAGQDKLAELGFTREKARETVKSLLDGALAAAATAGNAAVETARQKREDDA